MTKVLKAKPGRKVPHRAWTMKEVEYLRGAYKTKSVRQIAKEMGVAFGAVDGALNRYGIRCGRDGRFKKGVEVWNKGISCRLSPKTEFPKGHQPHNTKFDGAISWRRGGKGIKYKYLRLASCVWVLLHRYNWEQVHGPIPDSMILVFKDKNTANCEVSNLEMITKRDNALRNVNRKKAAEKLKEIWRIEKVRKKYGLPPKTKFGNRVKHAA